MKAVAALTLVCAAAFAAAFGSRADAQTGCQAGDALVSIRNFAYAPESITIAPGATVCWTNEDVTPTP